MERRNSLKRLFENKKEDLGLAEIPQVPKHNISFARAQSMQDYLKVRCKSQVMYSKLMALRRAIYTYKDIYKSKRKNVSLERLDYFSLEFCRITNVLCGVEEDELSIASMFYLFSQVDEVSFEEIFRVPHVMDMDESLLNSVLKTRQEALESWTWLRNKFDHVRFVEVNADVWKRFMNSKKLKSGKTMGRKITRV